MRILAFESSAKAAGTALVHDGLLLGESFLNSGQTHSRTLLSLAEHLLENCGLSPADIDACAVAAGPGSFTGIRIGMAAAKGFSWGCQIPLVGVSTLEGMTRGAAMCDGVYCACMDARRGQIYNALFRVQGGDMERLCADRAIAVQELEAELSQFCGPVFLLGDGAQLTFDLLDGHRDMLRLLPEHLRQQRASGTALSAWEILKAGGLSDASALAPNYLRMSQAERTRAENHEFYLKKK